MHNILLLLKVTTNIKISSERNKTNLHNRAHENRLSIFRTIHSGFMYYIFTCLRGISTLSTNKFRLNRCSDMIEQYPDHLHKLSVGNNFPISN